MGVVLIPKPDSIYFYENYERVAELTIEGVLQLFAESDKRMENLNQDLKLQFAETDKRMEKISRDLNKKIADLGDTLGRFAEEQVRADVINKFKHWGIAVHSITDHFEMQDIDGRFLYEVDILIYNEKYVVALEVKNILKTEDVDAHIEQMKKVQSYP